MDEFTQLRQLLLEEEQSRLDKLDQRLDDPTQRSRETAQVLPQAINLLSKQQPAHLHKALQNPVEHCVETSFQTDPQKFAKPLLNVMSQPLRKAIADSFKSIREFVQANQAQINVLDERVQRLEKRDWDALLKKLAKQETLITARLQQFETDIYDMDKRTSELAYILPNAIRKASELQAQQQAATDKMDKLSVNVEELSASLKGPVEMSLRQSISDDPHSLANALFPIMGPAIRKSINESIKGLINNINRTVERSLSPQGLAWRLEAIRTGRPFGEIVLQKTLVYRVEQVFLIHRDSGLLIQHLHLDGVAMGDSDAVSAMLTAIQDFIRDSFSASKKEELDSVDIGDFTVWLERGPYAVLACVMRGSAPYAFRSTMRALLELMHARYGNALEHFDGDTSSLEGCRPLLQKAIQVEEVEAESKKKQRRFKPVAFLFILLLLGLGAWLGYQKWQAHVQQQEVNRYLQALAQEPGIIVTQTQIDKGNLHLRGLRDPLARTHMDIAKETQFNALNITSHWQDYQAMSPTFVEQRLRQQGERWLKQPDTVAVQWQGTKLILSGHADKDWINRIENDAPMLLGLSELDTHNLVENGAYWRQTQAQFDAFLKALNNTPGIIVVSSGVDNNQRFINGMRDPLAADPKAIAEQMQIRSVAMHWRNYQDLTPEFVQQRVTQYLSPVPASVDYHIDGSQLHLSGHAPQAWLDKALRVTSVAGINKVDTSRLKDTDAILLARATEQLNPEDSIKLAVKQGKLSVSGAAEQAWIEDVLQNANIDGIEHIDTTKLQSHDALLLAKMQAALDTPEAVQLKVHRRALSLSGKASLPEIAQIIATANNIKGIKAIDASGLQDKDAPRRAQLRAAIDKAKLLFSDGIDLSQDQQRAAARLAQKIRELATLNAGLKPPLQVVLTGHTDGLGSRENNQALSQARANTIKQRLINLGVPQDMLVTQLPEKILFGERHTNLEQRKVAFRVEEKTTH